MKAKNKTLYMKAEVAQMLRELATNSARSDSNMVETLVRKEYKEYKKTIEKG